MATNGESWSLVTDTAAFGQRSGHAGCVHAGKMVISGGSTGVDKNDVWSSTDGITWTQVTAAAGWAARAGHRMVSFGGNLYITGGGASAGAASPFTDVWRSTDDGATWTEMVASAAYALRSFHAMEVFNGKMWVAGGTNPNTGAMYSNVYSSVDGATWTLEVASPGWVARAYFGSGVVNGRMYIFGGNVFTPSAFQNDCWSTGDGVTWRQETATMKPPAEAGISILTGQALSYNGRLWFLGGNALLPAPQHTEDDVWFSYDGRVWEKVALNPGFGAKQGGVVLAFNDLLWMIGGGAAVPSETNDVWKSEAVATPVGTVQHSQLGSPDLHEPKGMNSAAIDSVYVANGAGSGNWIQFPKASSIPSGGGAGIPAPVTLVAPTAYTPLTMAVSGNDTNIGFTLANGPKATYTGSRAAVVEAHFAVTVLQTNAAAQPVSITWRKNSDTQQQYEQIVDLAQNIRHSITSTIMLEMDTNDTLEIVAKVPAGNLTFDNAYLTCITMPTKEV